MSTTLSGAGKLSPSEVVSPFMEELMALIENPQVCSLKFRGSE
jgi:hypothetical protein